MFLYPPGGLGEVRDTLDRLDFQRQKGRAPFPEERPMRVGSVGYKGTRFLLHAHVLAADSPEIAVMRAFRYRLRADPRLLDAYVARKRCDPRRRHHRPDRLLHRQEWVRGKNSGTTSCG
jgi:hypothetical protein